MIRHLVIFAVTFALGVVAAVIFRTASHRPYEAGNAHADHAMTTAPAATPAPAADAHAEHGGMPMATPAAPTQPAPEHADHDHHVGPAPAAPAASTTASFNTICPGCGNPVNPDIPTAEYKGKKIGFNCAMCPPKFKADPEKYGEAALKNKEAE